MISREPTIYDVAEKAGVSASTVSRVINGGKSVKPETVQRVLSAIDLLNYRPNLLAHNLSVGHGLNTVGVVVPELGSEFFGKVVTGIESQLRKRGLHMMCSLSHGSPTEEQKVIGIFAERKVDGLLLLHPNSSDLTLLQFMNHYTPIVLVNRFLPELAEHCIRLDNVYGGYLATEHLLELGHTRIAHVSGPLGNQEARDRLDGYRKALSEAGIARDDSLAVEGDFTKEGGRIAAERLLQCARFTAVFAANDQLAVGVLLALREAGVDVPAKMSIVGFDNHSIAALMQPALTTVHYPTFELGTQAAKHLIDLIGKREPQPPPLLTPSLVVRESSGKVR